MSELTKKISLRIKQILKDRQFEHEVRSCRAEIFRMLRHYNKIRAEYYTEEERAFVLKNMKSAEKLIGELFNKRS